MAAAITSRIGQVKAGTLRIGQKRQIADVFEEDDHAVEDSNSNSNEDEESPGDFIDAHHEDKHAAQHEDFGFPRAKVGANLNVEQKRQALKSVPFKKLKAYCPIIGPQGGI